MAAESMPVIAAFADTSMKAFLALKERWGRLVSAGRFGEADELVIAAYPFEGFVWPQSAKRQLLQGKLRAMRDRDGNVVAYKRVYQIPAHARDGAKDSAESWQKTPSGPVHVMQLKRGRKGRAVPARQLAAAAAGL